MRIAVIGCGAMGGLFAASFARVGHRVGVLVRDPLQAALIEANGLSVTGPNELFQARVEVWQASPPNQAQDLIVLAVKAHQVEAVLSQLPPLLGQDTRVMTLQNGLGTPERLTPVVPADRIIVGVAENFGASRTSPCHIDHRSKRMIRLGRMGGGSDVQLEAIAQLWQEVGFPARVYERIDQLVWEKLVCNTTFSGATAISGLQIGELMAAPAPWAKALACGRETYEIGRALGIPFSFTDPERYATEFGAAIPLARTSMLQDILAGRATEAEAIHGGVVDSAARIGLEAPHNAAMLQAVLERTKAQRR